MRRSDIFGLLGIALVTFCGLWLFKSETGKALTGRWSFVRSVEVDKGSYFRLKVKLAYEGQPADFDIVVGCNVRQTNYKDGSNTYEVGLVPTVFGKRMDDGKGLVVRSPAACEGQTTENGRVMRDLLPIIVVYDDAETLAFGTGYMSEDAYESPLSVLKFGGATIEKADRKAFDEFRRAQPNLISRESYHSSLGASVENHGLNRVSPSFGNICTGYARYTIPEQMKAVVRKYWPASKPQYWQADGTLQERNELLNTLIMDGDLVRSDSPNDPLRPRAELHAPDQFSDDGGLWTRAGGGRVQPEAARTKGSPPALYPSISDSAAIRWPKGIGEAREKGESQEPLVQWDIHYRQGQTRGFAYCWSYSHMTETQLGFSIPARSTVTRVDGVEAPPRTNDGFRSSRVYERDEFIFLRFRVTLESTRGDV